MSSALTPDTPPWARNLSAERRGRFVVGPELGRGGMGVVNVAWDPLLKRLVALKQLLHSDPVQTKRFLREAQLQAKVEHPKVCKVYEVGTEGEQPYIAMQYLEGQSLGEVRGLDLWETARLFAEVAAALHAAHQTGLIHRDLKPANILVERHGEEGWTPHILDFGLARDLATADLTLTWGLVGTPAFMSPEQAAGHELTPRSDLYSLGATFYAVFAGRPPFEATTLVGLLTQQSASRAPSLRRLQKAFPRDLETILVTCLSPDPARRYVSALALEEDLRRWLAGKPIRARRIGFLELAWRQLQRHATLTLVIATGLVIAGGLLGWNVRSERRARVQVELAQRFSLQVREVEQLLRIERMLPVHDMRPAEAQVRRLMEAIRASMVQLGSVARGPGLYAIGRGHLLLGELELAGKALEAAWREGHQAPEVAFTLGTLQRERCMALRATMPQTADAERIAAEARLVRDGLQYFQRARGYAMEDPLYGAAQIASLKADFEGCIRYCREAFAARGWFYEAKLLEAEAWQTLAGRRLQGWGGRSQGMEAFQEHLREARGALAMAKALAPSDVRICQLEISLACSLTILDADTGRLDLTPFRHTEEVYARILAIRPDDRPAMSAWLYSRARHAMALLRTGQDARLLMRDTLEKAQALRLADPVGHANLAIVQWQLADGQWRRGEDPRPALRDMERHGDVGTEVFAQPACIEAEFLASRGLDPRPVFQRIERTLVAHAVSGERDFYYHVLWCHYLLIRAEWERDMGHYSRATLDLALQHADQGLRMNASVVYLWAFKGLLHARRAAHDLSHQQDAGRDLQAALEAGQRGRQCGSHYRVPLALSEAHLVQAQQGIARGEDPTTALDAARAACREGFKINPTDYRLHIQAARVDLEAARWGRELPRMELLRQAEATLNRGLRIKADCTRMWLLLAQTRRLQAQLAPPASADRSACMEAAEAALRRATKLHPSSEAAMEEGRRLAALPSQDGLGARGSSSGRS